MDKNGCILLVKLAIPHSLLRGHLMEGRVRKTVGFSVEQLALIPRQLATGVHSQIMRRDFIAHAVLDGGRPG
jgi:hypothetical protein